MAWCEFPEAITQQFSGLENFGKLLEVAALYKSKTGQSLQIYCFDKIKKLNKLNLDIPKEKVVEFVVHGIRDEQIKMSLTTVKKRTVPELTRCLNSLSAEINRNIKESKGKRRSVSRERARDKFKRFGPDTCFYCRGQGTELITLEVVATRVQQIHYVSLILTILTRLVI